MGNTNMLYDLKGRFVPEDVTDWSRKLIDEIRNEQHLSKMNEKVYYEAGDSIDIIYNYMAKHYKTLLPEPRKEKRLKPKKNPYFSKKMRFPG